jgi:hypothetical protein
MTVDQNRYPISHQLAFNAFHLTLTYKCGY